MADLKSLDPKDLAARVIELLEPELAQGAYELIDVRVFRGGGRLQLRIYVDVPGGGISLDQVTAVSRTTGMLLEEADLIPGQYVIEVSSPGIRRPLRTTGHFAGAVGEKVDLKVALENARRVRGVLRAVTEEELTVETTTGGETGEVTVSRARVLEANLDPDFDAQALIHADRVQKRDRKRELRRAKRGSKKSRPKAGKDKNPGDDPGTTDR